MLDLGHHPLVRLVGLLGLLGDQPVQPGPLELLEPGLRQVVVVGDRGDVDRRAGRGERLLQPGPALRERAIGQVLVAQRQQVERDEAGRRLLGQQVHPAGRGVDALLQHLELQRVALPVQHHDLAVDHRPLREVGQHRVDQLREVAGHRALVAAADLDLGAVPEDDRAEAVPLGLVQLSGGDLRLRLGQHRLHRRHHGQVHPAILPAAPGRVTSGCPTLTPRRSPRRAGLRAVARWTAAELAAARGRAIVDVLPGPADPPLRVLFCGINPGLVSAATGHHFARPGNRFWPALHGAGFTPRRLLPAEQGELAGLGLGITNLVARATARADELTVDELLAGGRRLRALVEDTRPAVAGRRRDHRLPHRLRAAEGADRPATGAARRDPDLGAAQPQRPERPLPAPRPDRRVHPPPAPMRRESEPG